MNTEPGLRIGAGRLAVTGRLADFWHWWSGELAELIPLAWRRRLRGRERVLHFNGSSFEYSDGGRQLEIPLAQAASHPLLTTWRTTSTRASLLVTWPQAQLLHRVISLPLATETRLDSVLGYELDRHTPFSAAEAGFGYRVLSRDRAAGRIEVELFVLPGSRREPIVAALAAAGLQADAMLPQGLQREQGARRTLNLLPPAPGQARRRARAAGVPIVLLLALVVLVAFLFQQRDSALQALQRQVAEHQQIAEQARRIQDEIDSLQAGGDYIRAQKWAQPSALVLLDELTRLLPDHTWLNRLELSDNQLRMQGESASASELLGLLEASPLFSQAEFISPVTINPRSRKERFSLTLVVASPEVMP